jgi:hypothetical protein
MHTLKLKHITHEFHYPDLHESTMWMKHVLSSEFFWAVFALVVLVAIMVTLAILATSGSMKAIEVPMGQPYYPFFP